MIIIMIIIKVINFQLQKSHIEYLKRVKTSYEILLFKTIFPYYKGCFKAAKIWRMEIGFLNVIKK